MVSDPRRHSDKLGERAVAPERRCRNSNYLAVIAKVDLAALTIEALAAIDSRIERHSIARAKILHRTAHGFNCSRGLVSHHNRRKPPARAAIVAVYVAPANSASANANQEFMVCRFRC